MQVQLGAEWVVAALLASAMCLCGGDRSWPQQLPPGSGQERGASLHVHPWACVPSPRRAGHSQGTWPCPPRMHYSEPSALSASSLGCLAPCQPGWPCPHTAEAGRRCPGTQRRPGELLMGPVLCPAPHSQPLRCFWTPYAQGNVAGSALHPLQLQPVLSKFLCLMQGGETTQRSKGRAHGALSCWAGGRLFL